MAGIGFELKKLFNRQGLFASFRAYGYAGVVCTGPMLLGICIASWRYVIFVIKTGGSRHSRELLVCMITYTLLFSLTVSSGCKEKDMSMKMNEPHNIKGVISYKRSLVI